MTVSGMELWEDLSKYYHGMVPQLAGNRSHEGWCLDGLFQVVHIQALKVTALEPLVLVTVFELFCLCGNQQVSQ